MDTPFIAIALEAVFCSTWTLFASVASLAAPNLLLFGGFGDVIEPDTFVLLDLTTGLTFTSLLGLTCEVFCV